MLELCKPVNGAHTLPSPVLNYNGSVTNHTNDREVASLNEFRTFFGLEPHKTFEDVNPDKEIQKALQDLYDSPDMIEMYPGIFIEETKKSQDFKPSGVGFPATAGRGVLSDAVTLVRSDRFYTTVCILKTSIKQS